MGLKEIGGMLIVPAVGVGTFFLVKNNKKLSTPQKVGIVAGSTVLTYLVRRTYLSYAGNVKKAPVDYGQIPTLPGGLKWDPAPLAKEIYENFEGWNAFTYPETTDKISALQPDQLRLLYNHYNAYHAAEFPTLTKLIEAEWPQTPTAYTSYARAVAALKAQGLNDYF